MYANSIADIFYNPSKWSSLKKRLSSEKLQ